MTMPYGEYATEEPDMLFVEEQSIAPHVVSSGKSKSIGAEFGQFRTFLVANVVQGVSSTPGAQRIANRSLRRKRLLIAVMPTIAAQAVLDGAIFGSREFINSGNPMNPSLGIGAGYLQIGISLRWECQQELWVAYPTTNVNSVFVTVCDEVFASEQPEGKGDE
jgi:hypothetical protein